MLCTRQVILKFYKCKTRGKRSWWWANFEGESKCWWALCGVEEDVGEPTIGLETRRFAEDKVVFDQKKKDKVVLEGYIDRLVIECSSNACGGRGKCS